MLIWAVLVRTWPCRNSKGGFLGWRYPRDVIFIPKRFIKWAGCRRVEGHDYRGGLLLFPREKAAMWQISIKSGPVLRGKLPHSWFMWSRHSHRPQSTLTISTAPTLNSHFIKSETKLAHYICPRYDPFPGTAGNVRFSSWMYFRAVKVKETSIFVS